MMKMLEKREVGRAWLQSAYTREFFGYVHELAGAAERRLRSASKDTEVFRAQGELAAFDKILELKKEVERELPLPNNKSQR